MISSTADGKKMADQTAPLGFVKKNEELPVERVAALEITSVEVESMEEVIIFQI